MKQLNDGIADSLVPVASTSGAHLCGGDQASELSVIAQIDLSDRYLSAIDDLPWNGAFLCCELPPSNDLYGKRSQFAY